MIEITTTENAQHFDDNGIPIADYGTFIKQCELLIGELFYASSWLESTGQRRYNTSKGNIRISLQCYGTTEYNWVYADTFLEVQGEGNTLDEAVKNFDKKIV